MLFDILVHIVKKAKNLQINELRENGNKSKEITVIKQSCTKLFGITFFLTLTNPMTILSFIGIFPAICDINFSFHEALVMVAGIFFGSMCWWLILGGIISCSKKYLPDNLFVKIRLISALILALFGF